jgi:hypothetical protein
MDNPPRRWGRSDTPPPRWLSELLQDEQQLPSGKASWYATSPDGRSVRVVWNGWSVEGARIRDTYRQTDRTVRPTGRLAAEVRQAFAEFLAEEIVAAVWPVPSTGMSLPATNAEMLSLAEELLDPRILAAKLIEATVQVAAVHAGIPPPVARVMGQAAGKLFLQLVSPDPDARKVEAVQYVDLIVSAKDGSVLDSPALPQIAAGETADVINRLLGPDDLRPDDPTQLPAKPSGLWPDDPTQLPAKPGGLWSDDPTRPAKPGGLRPDEPKPPPPVDEGFGFEL